MKKLLCALACGALLLCGGMSVARADYYEMYNPATHVEGGAMVYETTRGVLMNLKVHSGEWQDDHYRYETEASGVVRFAHDGERFIGYLQVPSLTSLENGMGYPSQYRYSMPLYEKYADVSIDETGKTLGTCVDELRKIMEQRMENGELAR